MNIGDFLPQATHKLRMASITSARLECIVLLEDALGLDRAQLLAHLEYNLSHETEVELHKKIMQRTKHIPLAYIRGKAPFYGRDFLVSKHVLVPRPETETVIEILKTLPLQTRPRIADIGTGSGCLGITAALELENAIVHLYDIDKKALTVAQQNATNHHVKVVRIESDLLTRYAGPYEVLLVNLPYVPTTVPINRAAQYEPKLALFAGTDGLTIYRRFWRQIGALQQKPTVIITESLPQQHDSLQKMSERASYRLKGADGFIQWFSPFN